MSKNFEIAILREADDFIKTLGPKCQDKIYYNLRKSQRINDPKILKKLKGCEIWEFRT